MEKKGREVKRLYRYKFSLDEDRGLRGKNRHRSVRKNSETNTHAHCEVHGDTLA
jgi:hypothetical protein